MKRLLSFVGATIASGIGWWLGSFIGIFSAIMLSSVLGILGYYLTSRWLTERLG